MSGADREILLSFWKVHILHHAGEESIHGQWVLTELRRHGWLKCRREPRAGPRARTDYRLTAEGHKVLALVREQLKALYREVVR